MKNMENQLDNFLYYIEKKNKITNEYRKQKKTKKNEKSCQRR